MAVPRVSTMTGVALVVFTVGLKISLAQHNEPCSTYQILDDRWRNPEANAALDHCDDFAEGWYALQVDKDPAEIPKLCLQDSTCGVKVPLHVEMEGQSTPDVGENITAWLCGSYNVLGSVDCCVQRQSVTIKRCTQDVFIYWLKPQRICPVGVCAARLGSVISEQYMAKYGDIPRSLTYDPPQSGTTPTTPVFTFPEICPEGLPECPDGTCGPCPPTAAPTSPVPTPPPSTTPQEIERTLGTVAFRTNPSPPTPVPMDNSTIFSPSSPAPGDSNASSAHSSNMSAVFSPNDTSDGSKAAESSLNDTMSFNTSSSDQNMSGDNITKGMPGTAHPSDVGVDNETSTADDNMASLSNNLTSGHNASDAKSESSEDAATPEIKPSMGSLETTMMLSTVSSDDLKNVSAAAGFPTPVGPASASPGFGSSPGSGGAMFTAVPVSVPPISEAVRFVLNGTFEEAEFRDTLLSFVNNVSQQLTAGPPQEQGLHNVTLLAQTSLPQHITVVDVLVDDPTTNGTIPAQRFVTIIENDKFAEILLSQAGQTILYVCPSVDRCEDKVAPGDGGVHDDPGHLSLFDRNRGIFIAVIAVAACCLLALLVGLLLVRYRRRGVWVLAPDQEEKGAEPLAVENPMTDHQILNGEGRESETTLTINGDHHHHTYATSSPAPGNGAHDNGHHDIPAADEDNGWVVPLDQAPPPAAHGLAAKTEDTQF